MYCGNPELFSTSVYRSVTRIKTRLRKSIEKCWQFYNSIEKLGRMVTVPHLYVKLWKNVTILHVNKNNSKMMSYRLYEKSMKKGINSLFVYGKSWKGTALHGYGSLKKITIFHFHEKIEKNVESSTDLWKIMESDWKIMTALHVYRTRCKYWQRHTFIENYRKW